MPKLEGKFAVVTGASRGLGRETAIAFAREGADVVLAARTESDLNDTAEFVRSLGRRAVTVRCDVARPEDVEALLRVADAAYGRVDILVNNAGRITPIGPLQDIAPAEWLDTMMVNLGGTFLCCHEALPVMLRQGGGKIINISGGRATSTFPNFSAYTTSKSAILRFTETLAAEVKNLNIQINAIAPGALRTRMTQDILHAGDGAGDDALAEAQQVQESGGTDLETVTGLAVFLASDESGGLTGRVLSALWDDWQGMTPERIEEISETDWYTVRRVVPSEGN